MLPVTEILEACLDPKSERFSYSSAERNGAMAPVVVWNVTNSCNMRCPHCYSAAVRDRSQYGLPLADLKHIARRLKERGVRVVIVSGGEPLLRDDIEELVCYLKELHISSHLSTNGILLTPARVRSLKEAGIVYVGVSIDGLPEFNDGYRRLRSAFRLAMAGLENARLAGLRTGMRMTITSANAAHLDALLQIAESKQINRFYLSHLVYGGRARDMIADDVKASECRLHIERFFETALQLLQRGSKLQLVTGGNDADGPALFGFVRNRLGNRAAAIVWQALLRRGGNSAGEKVINVDHLGFVHPDQFWRESQNHNLLELSLDEILGGPLYAKLRKREAWLTGRCARCRFVSVCRGSHRERALAMGGALDGDDPACYLSDEFIESEIYPVREARL